MNRAVTTFSRTLHNLLPAWLLIVLTAVVLSQLVAYPANASKSSKTNSVVVITNPAATVTSAADPSLPAFLNETEFLEATGSCPTDDNGNNVFETPTPSVITAPQHGRLTFSTINFPDSSCGPGVFPFSSVSYTWTDATSFTGDQDSFAINWSTPDAGVVASNNWVMTLANGRTRGNDADASLGDPTDTPGGCSAGDPCSVGTGSNYQEVTDYSTAGQNTLSFKRFYNSLASNTILLRLSSVRAGAPTMTATSKLLPPHSGGRTRRWPDT